MPVSLGRRLFFYGLIASLSVTAALAIGILLFAEFNDTTGKIFLTTGLVGAFSLVALPFGGLLDKGRLTWLAWLGLGLALAAFAITMVLVWRNWEDEGGEPLWKVVTLLASFAVALSQIAAMTGARRSTDSYVIGLLWRGSTLLALVGATMISIAALAEVDSTGYFRFVGAIVVADLLFVLVQAVMRRMGPRAAEALTVYAFDCTLEGGKTVAFSVSAASFADAIAAEVARLERDGSRVERIERRPRVRVPA